MTSKKHFKRGFEDGYRGREKVDPYTYGFNSTAYENGYAEGENERKREKRYCKGELT